jgi:ABC-type multidrug transport system ATPase subunit
MGICSQDDCLFPGLTPLDHIKLICQFSQIDVSQSGGYRKYALSILKDVDLDFEIDNKVESFSGGMKRRLSLVLAYVGQKPFVFLDEPTTGLVIIGIH